MRRKHVFGKINIIISQGGNNYKHGRYCSHAIGLGTSKNCKILLIILKTVYL